MERKQYDKLLFVLIAIKETYLSASCAFFCFLLKDVILRGMMDEEGEQFVTYFLPTKETLDKRMTDTENGKQFDPDYTYVYFVAVVLSR